MGPEWRGRLKGPEMKRGDQDSEHDKGRPASPWRRIAIRSTRQSPRVLRKLRVRGFHHRPAKGPTISPGMPRKFRRARQARAAHCARAVLFRAEAGCGQSREVREHGEHREDRCHSLTPARIRRRCAENKPEKDQHDSGSAGSTVPAMPMRISSPASSHHRMLKSAARFRVS